jgi:hypothetical protein
MACQASGISGIGMSNNADYSDCSPCESTQAGGDLCFP